MTICRWMLVFALFSAWAVSAQEQQQDVIVHKEFNVMVGTPAVGPVMAPLPQGGPPEHTFQFIAAEMGFNNKVVKGKPYSAEAVTETSQALADGNRITRKMSASVYRDGEGRTRREQTLGMIGPFKPQGAPPVTITIEDPVAGVHYMLDPQGKVAVKLPLRMPESGITAKQQAEHVTEVRMRAPGGGAPPNAAVAGMASAGQVFYQRMSHSGQSKSESLGKQTIEGLSAEGTRTVTTIPAGEIGNERPIEIAFERWFAPQIETVIMTRHTDPRQGETVYKLTNIQTVEPPRNLFEVPADYRIEERPVFRHARPASEPK